MSEIENLRVRIDGSWSELAGVVDSMDPGALAATGMDGWAVKDHITHVSAWELSLIGLFEGNDRLEAMGLAADSDTATDAINTALFELHRPKTADQALAYFRDTHAQLMAVMAKMTDSDLELPYSHFQPGSAKEEGRDRPVIGWVAGNTYDHYAEHVGWIKTSLAKGN
jgi:hypothetical protein